MSNKLALLQTSPPSNPDTNLCSVAVSGNYTNGTADPLPLTAIADPGAMGQVPMNNPGAAPPPVTPEVFGYWNGYYAQVQRTTANGVTSFGLRWYSSQGNELGSGAFPAAITGGETFLRIVVPLFKQA
jgi:hypothetical protein